MASAPDRKACDCPRPLSIRALEVLPDQSGSRNQSIAPVIGEDCALAVPTDRSGSWHHSAVRQGHSAMRESVGSTKGTRLGHEVNQMDTCLVDHAVNHRGTTR